MSGLFSSGIRPAIDDHLLKLSQEKRDYGEFWSASSAGYCMRKVIFQRLGVPPIEKDGDARKQRIFTSGHIFHSWIQELTKEAGLSIVQEMELIDRDLMVKGHFDDLVLIRLDESGEPLTLGSEPRGAHLILYDYKTQNSRAFTYQKGKPMSYYHKMQLGTYLLLLRTLQAAEVKPAELDTLPLVSEARILKISKDDLRMDENQLLWSEALEKEVIDYWAKLNMHWVSKRIPKCSCADHEGGFLASPKYNDYFYEGEPCSLQYYNKCKSEGLLKETI